MIQGKNRPPQGGNGASLLRCQQAGNPNLHRSAAMQAKMAMTIQKKQPAAPPVYRPQAPFLAAQPKMANGAVNRQPPVTPPVYPPQPVPKVLQTKSASAQSTQAGQAPRQPVAPPVYGPPPTPNALQPKQGGASPTAARTALPSPPQPPSQVIQCNRPPGAIGKVTYYKLNGKERATDNRNHWYKNQYGSWTIVSKTKVPSYNRFKLPTTGKGGERKASFKSTFGSAASYTDQRRRVQADRIMVARAQQVTAIRNGKRAYAANMLVATTTEGLCPTNSATAYAAFFNAPIIGGGYNWCHLIGHGAGGSDDAANIMAGSTHCNSEQLQIEKIVYQYRNKGVWLSCQSERHANSLYLARYITYRVSVNGRVVYTRRMDGFRATKPSFVEVAKVAEDLTKAITDELV